VLFQNFNVPDRSEHYSLEFHSTSLTTMEGINANTQNRAYVGPNSMGFSTSSPSATTGGGQGNSPVSSYLVIFQSLSTRMPNLCFEFDFGIIFELLIFMYPPPQSDFAPISNAGLNYFVFGCSRQPFPPNLVPPASLSDSGVDCS
jgi:hypothetical protein